MKVSNELTERLGIDLPVIQAPMAGGTTTPELVAAVSAAGAFGFIGAAYLSPEAILEAVARVRALTDRPFGINLFTPQPDVGLPADTSPALQALAPLHAELGLAPPVLPNDVADPFHRQMPAVVDSGVRAFGTTFGIPPAGAIAAARAAGMLVMGTATTVEEAVRLEAAGADAVVAQGAEAGGHRGTFVSDFESSMIGTMALVPQVVDAVTIPVIASGGIMDGRGVAAALALGASAAQMGTAFLLADESGSPDCHKQAVLDAAAHETRVTRAFSGRPARGVVNRAMTAVDHPDHPERMLPYPVQNALTRPMRTAAGKRGEAQYLSLWAANIVSRIARELAQAVGSIR